MTTTEQTDDPPVWTGPMTEEREILTNILVDAVEWGFKHVARCAPTDPEESTILAQVAVVGIVRRLRTMSARQLAVFLADEPNTGSGWVIHEPPYYTDEQIG